MAGWNLQQKIIDMKPKGIEWIPLFGLHAYLKRYYFGADERTAKEAYKADLFCNYYHCLLPLLITIAIISLIKHI